MKTPLEGWIAERIGAGTCFSQATLQKYQEEKLSQTIAWAIKYSPFYRNMLQYSGVFSLAEFQKLPFTTDQDIRREPLQFLCVSQDAISRVVTLESSGTTGTAKRLFFTPLEQEMTVSFFQYGMASLAPQGARIIILFPGQSPGSLGNLLKVALARLGGNAFVHGVVENISETLRLLSEQKFEIIVGIPFHVLALARYAEDTGIKLSIKGVLLSSDYVPQAIIDELQRIWNCRVITHYGMTEMALGGGTECIAAAGYHLHEADFYFEIIDPLTGNHMPDGEEGEVVVTTLTRRGMPLIRYRTGDISHFLPGPCVCGGLLRRLARIKRRKNGLVSVCTGQQFALADLDEQIFAIAGVTNFTAAVDNSAMAATLHVTVSMFRPNQAAESDIYQALLGVPAIYHGCQNQKLSVTVTLLQAGEVLSSGTGKRSIVRS